jgi:cell division protein FtsB
LTLWTNFMARLVAGAAALFLVGAFGAQMWHVGVQSYHLHKQIVSVEDRNASLQTQSVKLSRQIQLLHNPDYLVPLIHEQLGLVKPHEVFIELQPTPSPTAK